MEGDYTYDPFEMNRQALMKQMSDAQSGRPSAAGAAVDQAGDLATNVAPTVTKALNPGFKPNVGAGLAVGIGGELLGSLLKPHAQQAQVGDFGDYLSPLGRRKEGSGDGILGGMAKWGGRGGSIGSVVPGIGTAIGAGIGALAGGIGNLFTRNAASAQTDFTVDGAKQAIRDIYKQEGGRDVSDAEVNTILAGQGLKPGDHWVGEKGILSVLGSLRGNFQRERQALTSQMKGPAPV